VMGHEQLRDLINKRAGQASEVVVDRAGRRVTLTITPLMDTQMKRGRIGIQFANTPVQYRVQWPGPLPWVQIAEVWDRTIGTLNALIYSKQTGVRAKDLSGPVGIFAVLAAQVNTDYRLALSFLVLLSVNLAVLNLLPVPVLDGGHILLSVVEWIRRRPLSARFVEYTTTAFAVALISFMLYVTVFDVLRIPIFKSLFQRESQIEQPGAPPPPPAPAPAPTPAR